MLDTVSHSALMTGAKGGGGGSNFTQKPDNLRSADTFEGLLGLCAGPIKGPVNGLKSVRLNGTPIEDVTGKSNFENFTAVFADGDPLKYPQLVSLRLGSAGAPDAINVQLRNTSGTGNGTWSTHTVTDQDAEAIDLRFIVNQLYKQSKKGIFENTLNIEIQMKPIGTATWINPFTGNGNTTPPYSSGGYDQSGKGGSLKIFLPYDSYPASAGGGYTPPSGSAGGGSMLTVSGKTTSPYIKELRVKVPNTGTYLHKGWDIRCRLHEIESVDKDPDFEKRNVTWESSTAVFGKTLGNHPDWQGLAWLQIYGKASDTFTSLPEVDGIYDLKIVSVPPPNVYDPINRTYTGTIWDGSWAKSWTQDPAWCINDAISDSLHGLATLVPGAQLNKWDALELSKWCSQQVPNGAGGTHPRHSMNLITDTGQKSDEYIRFLAGSVGATAWDDGGGKWRVKVDKPETPVDVFTLQTIEGEFEYSHTDIDTRFNDVTVVFLNEEFDYREDRVRVEADWHINKFGRKPTKVVGIGITNRQQALRWAILRLRTNTNEFRAVSFTTNRRGKLLERFNQILIADETLNVDPSENNFIRTTGRIVNNKGGSIVLRDTVRLEIGVTYLLHVTYPNPNYDPDPLVQPTSGDWTLPTITTTRTITNDAAHRGDVTELFLNTALPAGVAANANIALEASGLPAIPKVYRITDIEYLDDGERVTINAMEIDTGKWPAADNADPDLADLEPPKNLVDPPIAPVDGVWVYQTWTSDFGIKPVLTANWVRPAEAFFDKYKLEYRFNNGAVQQLGTTRDNFYEIPNVQEGTHEIWVYAIDRFGRTSLPLKSSYDVTEVAAPRNGFGPNELYDDTFLAPNWNLLPKTTRLYRNANNGFPAGNADYLLEWQIPLSGTDALAEVNNQPRRTPVVAGKRYYFMVWAQRTAGASDTPVYIGLDFHDAAGASLGASPGGRVSATWNTSAMTAAGPPEAYIVSAIAPAGAVSVRSYIIIAPVVGATGFVRFERPSLSSIEPGADITTLIDGPTDSAFKFSSTGIEEPGEFPRPLAYTLRNAAGVISSGITWEYAVFDGSVNNNATNVSTYYAMGGPTLNVTSLESDTATVQVRATYQGVTRTKVLTLTREYLAPPSTGGSTGGGTGGTGGTAGPSQTSGFLSFSTTTPTPVSNVLTMNVTGGTATISVNLTIRPATGPDGTWTVNLKVERETSPGSGSWVTVGVVQSRGTYCTTEVFPPSEGGGSHTTRSFANVTYAPQATGLASGNHNFRISCYLSSGTRSHSVTGTVTVSTP